MDRYERAEINKMATGEEGIDAGGGALFSDNAWGAILKWGVVIYVIVRIIVAIR